jgi:hypothetical protein
MLRILLQYLLPLVLPLLVYLAYARLAGKRGGLSDTPWLGLAAAGVALMAASLAAWGIFGGAEPGGTYVPARVEDGQLVPGRVEP